MRQISKARDALFFLVAAPLILIASGSVVAAWQGWELRGTVDFSSDWPWAVGYSATLVGMYIFTTRRALMSVLLDLWS